MKRALESKFEKSNRRLHGSQVRTFSQVTYLVRQDEDLPEITTTVLVVCSNGCFQDRSFVRLLLQADSSALGALPIIVDGSFQFPSEPFDQELRARADYSMEGTGRHVEDLISFIGTMFQEIGISLRCQESQAILEVSMWMEMPAVLCFAKGGASCRAVNGRLVSS